MADAILLDKYLTAQHLRRERGRESFSIAGGVMGNGHQVQIARKRHFTVGTFNSVPLARCSSIEH